MRVKGTLTKWLDDKGFGFITPLAGGREVFVHINSFVSKGQRPEQGCVLTYELVKDKQGRLNAGKVTHQGERLNQKPNLAAGKSKNSSANKYKGSNSFITFTLLFSIVFIIALFALVIFTPLSFHFFTGYLILSLLTFIFYGVDKRAAQKGSWRISEKQLHLLALIGGWPGAVFAQQTLRHKSKKLSFRIELWLAILINVAVFVWFFVPGAQALIKQVVAMFV
ncbi:DUF1294 domain-containing protein [Thalassomonas sp. M1454]|uniref:DUF1294 domain-containing protein n=1 Tax=Thalassomonas sp. M1454 TaxID=2594477 RepID=UPI001180B225|nr:DUF1294 domain-containing protein [Thalassomonas sp. M1454]TRX56710.1 DUF1294 domain-containing protein [Thalassomonas sp. M1454]